MQHRSLLVLGFALAFSAVQPTCRSQEVLDGIAAVVNADVITFSQVRELIGPTEMAARKELKGEELTQRVKEIRLRAINDLIDRQLIIQEFNKNKFQIPEHYVENQVATIIRDEFGGDRSAFIRTLGAQGYSFDKFKQMEREKMIVQAMRSQNVKADVIVPEQKIRQYYEQHREEFAVDDQIKLRMIAIGKREGNDSGRKMIEEIRGKIVSDGAEFADMARLYSEEEHQDDGGDWGWINRRTLNESLAKVAFSLKAGTVSSIIELGNRYYLLLVEAKKNSTVKPIGELRDDIQSKLIQLERQRKMEEWIGRLRKKAYIKTF
jgi:parvulin-like peptidyl-prolyl isomerase